MLNQRVASCVCMSHQCPWQRSGPFHARDSESSTAPQRQQAHVRGFCLLRYLLLPQDQTCKQERSQSVSSRCVDLHTSCKAWLQGMAAYLKPSENLVLQFLSTHAESTCFKNASAVSSFVVQMACISCSPSAPVSDHKDRKQCFTQSSTRR